ncbi:hypothetical protein [Pollutibacter soli]|uniref:hypothetical protein n=1 Tax=Pollutibacter soli TaxID=3034157 RepID=UPI003013C12B
MKKIQQAAAFVFCMMIACHSMTGFSQSQDSTKQRQFKNVIRYNLSGALLFGVDRYVVFGYERILSKRQSMSMNIGRASLPKLVTISTDSFQLQKDLKNNGFNFSLDYRFYLQKENKYNAPHGLYIGPYYSFNNFERENQYTFLKSGGTTQVASSDTKFSIHTIGGELGYQFVLWKRFSIDLVMIGPGISAYKIEAKFGSDLTEEQRAQLRDAVQDMLTQKFPGMNYVLSDKELNANGVMKTTSIGFRYIVHIGFVF